MLAVSLVGVQVPVFFLPSRTDRRTQCGRKSLAGTAQNTTGLRRHSAQGHRKMVGTRVCGTPDRRLAQGRIEDLITLARCSSPTVKGC